MRQKHKGRCYVIPKRGRLNDQTQRGSEGSKVEEGSVCLDAAQQFNMHPQSHVGRHIFFEVSLTVVYHICDLPSNALTVLPPLCDLSAGLRTPGQKVRPQSRQPFLLSMRLKSPGRLQGSSPPISTNQVTNKLSTDWMLDGYVQLVFQMHFQASSRVLLAPMYFQCCKIE